MVGIKNSNTTAIAAIPIATNTHLFIFINILIAEKKYKPIDCLKLCSSRL